MNKPDILMFTDGGASRQKNTAGYATVLNVAHYTPYVIYGGAIGRTNNWAELMAILLGVQQIKIPSNIHIIADSKYAINVVDKWMFNWNNNNWKTKLSKDVKNRKLIEALLHYVKPHHITFTHQKSHTNGTTYNALGNDLADTFATRGLIEAYNLGYDFITY